MKRRGMLIGAAAVTVGGAGVALLGLRQMGSMDDYNAAVAASRAPLSRSPEARDLVRFATLAANSHNTQAWRFSLASGGIEIRPDLGRRLAAVDSDNHHLYVSLGCAAENLSIAAAARGKAGELNFFPEQDGVVRFAFGNGPSQPSELFEAITKRQSTRGDYNGRPIGAADLQALRTAAGAVRGVDLVLITDRPRIDRVRDLVMSGNSAQIADPAFMRELKGWLRFSPRQALRTGDGLFSATSGNPVLPDWLGSLAIDMMFTAGAENDKYSRQIASSAGIAVFVAEHDDPEHWVASDRARHEARVRQSTRRGAFASSRTGGSGWHAGPSPRYLDAVRLRACSAVLRTPPCGSGADVTPPFTIEQFLGVFADYNAAIWPSQVVALVLGLIAIVALSRRWPIATRLIPAILALMWAVNGIGYHFLFFAAINPAAPLFAGFFVAQAILLAASAMSPTGLRFETGRDFRTVMGAGFIAYAMALYPVIGIWAGHGLMKGPMFGVAPCPTTIFTIGMLLMARGRRVAWLAIIPLLWSLIGLAAAWQLGIPEDVALPVAGAVLLMALVLDAFRRPHRLGKSRHPLAVPPAEAPS